MAERIDVMKARKLLAEGLKTKDVALRLGCHRTTLSKALKRQKPQIRKFAY